MGADVPFPEPTDDDLDDASADEAAALDDYLGGFSAGVDSAPTPSGAPEQIASTLDLILRLRQTAAAEGGEVRLPAANVPTAIGRYQVIAAAGEGGFAFVWEAFDPLLRRRVAVKVRRPDALLSPTLRRRFLREAEIASRLVHPHIVTIHEVGEDDGREYIVEEFCDGGSLAAWLARHPGPLPPRTAVRVVLFLAEAAAYAHEQGVIHRDIKPANVLLTAASQPDEAILSDRLTAKLADFGLGTLHEEASDLTQLTASGSRLGTPSWMAPEQIDCSFGAVGPATDVHALGLLLHRLLTGQSPHAGRTDVEIYRSVMLDEAVSPDRIVPGIPRDLAAVTAACLAKQSADRYPSAAALAADLKRFLAGSPTTARPLSPAARLGRVLVRKRVVASLAAGLVVAFLGMAWSARAWRAEGRAAQAQREEIREKTAAVELQRAFEAWRTGNVSRAVVHAAEVRELSPSLADSLGGRWLQRRLHGERRMLFEPASALHPAAAHTLAVAPDGRLIAAGFADGTLRLIDRQGRCTAEIVAAHDEINDVCFSADGRMLATAGQDGRCRWWQVTDALKVVPTGTLACGAPLYGVAFLADGRHLATGGEDRVLRVVDMAGVESPRLIRFAIPEDEPAEIEAVIRVSGDTVAVACGDHVFIVDATGEVAPRELEHRRPQKHPPVFHSLAISPDGKRAAAGSSERRVRVWSLEDGRLVSFLPVQPAWVYGCGFSADGSLVAAACRDGVIRLFRVGSDTPQTTLQGHVGRVWDVALDADGGVISAGGDGTIREWDPACGPEFNGVEHVRLEGGAFDHVEALPNGSKSDARLIVSGHRQPPLMLLESRDANTRRSVGFNLTIDDDAPLNGLAVDPEGIRCAMSFTRRPFAVGTIDPDSPSACVDLPVASPSAGFAAWTPQGRLITVASEDQVTLWSPDLRSGTTVARIDWLVGTAAAAPAGSPRVAVAGHKLMIVRLPLESEAGASANNSRWTSAKSLEIPIADSVYSVAWSPDGRQLLCGSRNGEAAVYDAHTGERTGALVPHARGIVGVAWSPDGRVLLTADDVGMRLSDAGTLVTFDEVRPGWTITDVAVGPGGDLVAIAGWEPSAPPQRAGRLATLKLLDDSER